MQAQLVLVALVSSAAALKLNLQKQNAEDYVQCEKLDGFGAQYHCQIAAFALARYKGVCFKHNPFFPGGFHNEGEFLDRKNWLGNKTRMDAEKFTGLKSDANCGSGKTIHIENPMTVDDGASPEPVEKYYTPAVREELRQLYWSTPKPEVDAKCQVAMHVRRGDVHPIMNGGRFTDNKVLRDAVVQHFPTKTVCVYSQGKPEQFGPLAQLNNTVFKLNGPTDAAFHGLVTAPELITAKSSFSYAAGLITKGKVHYISRFWHKALKEWDQLDMGKSFARENLDTLVEPPPEAEPSDFD